MRPMLAAKVTDVHALRYPLLASPKLDGIRCVISYEGKALTRALKPIPNVHVREWLEANCPRGWDGELMLPAPATFQDVSSCFMNQTATPPADWFYAVFDWMPAPITGVEQRRLRKGACAVNMTESAQSRSLRLRLTVTPGGRAVRVPQIQIHHPEDLLAFETRCLSAGYEGVMVRDPEGPYKHGRATLKEGWLLKLKRFEDGEAEVIGFVERQHNTNAAQVSELGLTKRSHAKAGMVGNNALGALQVRDLVSGIEFEIGTGFDEQQRRAFWENRQYITGRIAKYRHFAASGVKDKPRFPVWLGWRSKEDM